MLIPPVKTKQTLDVNHALKTLREHKIQALKHCFKLVVMTDNGYDEVKSFTHQSIKKTFKIVLKCGRSFVISELYHLQQELLKARKIHNAELNFKKSHKPKPETNEYRNIA